MKQYPTQKRLIEVFDYKNGVFYWKTKHAARTTIGKQAGRYTQGYCSIGLDGGRYLRSRLVWIYFNGKKPNGVIDHINRITTDDRIENLRDITKRQNERNQNVKPNNTSGYGNISWCKRDKKWTVRIKGEKKYHYFGRYETIEEALSAKLSALCLLGYDINHGLNL